MHEVAVNLRFYISSLASVLRWVPYSMHTLQDKYYNNKFVSDDYDVKVLHCVTEDGKVF